jgi:hypothetical protein
MSKIVDPHTTPAPVRVREVEPDDRWGGLADTGTGGRVVSVVPRLIESERGLPSPARAGVLYFDLSRFSSVGNAIDPVIDWAEHYHRSRGTDEVPACLVAIGRKVRRRDQLRLAEAGIHFLDEGRDSLRRLLGSGPRDQQIYRLIQNLCGFPIAGDAFPYPGAARSTAGARASAVSVVSPIPGPGAPGATASDWDAYTQRPSHIDPAEVKKLFGMLTHEPPEWERDS